MVDVNKMLKIKYILNSPVLTSWGYYEFYEYTGDVNDLDLSNAVSAIGHESTAELLSQLLGISIKMNRIKIQMRKGDIALVFTLHERVEEGSILSYDTLQKYSYSLGILKQMK